MDDGVTQVVQPAIRDDRKRGPLAAVHRVRSGFTRKHLAELFRDVGVQRMAEIGVADGRYSELLCETIPGLRLLCVDPWAPYTGNRRGGPIEQHQRNYARATERLAPYQASLIRQKSEVAVMSVPDESLDAVYIDGNHAYQFVLQDLLLWGQRVKRGGIVAGHDYYHFNGAGVVEAVNFYTSVNRISDWWLCDEREPSFWWIKP
jgi:hypothetical protein